MKQIDPATYQPPVWRWRWVFFVIGTVCMAGAVLAAYDGAWWPAVTAAGVTAIAFIIPPTHLLTYQTGYENGRWQRDRELS